MRLFDQKSGKPRQTRLSFRLRQLEIKDDPAGMKATRRDMLAEMLDRTVLSLGLKGRDVQYCAAYVQAAKYYKELTGKDFAG